MSVHQWDAADYSRNSAMQQRFAVALMERAPLRGDEQILDIGCGDGKVTAQLAAQTPRGAVVGVDVSPDMIQFAQEAYPPAVRPNLRFMVCDASRLNFSAAFDLVVSFSALHWVIDHRPVLAGIHRALKPGGRVLMQFGGQGNMGVLDDIARQIPSDPRWSRFFDGFVYPWGFYGPDEYRPWLKAADFTVTHLALAIRDVTHPGRDGWNAWIRTAWPGYINRIPADQRQAFIDDLGDRYFAHHPIGPDGQAHVRMVRLEVDAYKPAQR
ncbi:MAG: methyltransferase domain-containing protein [Chloroflexi bacterium]|nr:methyltransferase domain-containing protein [Chloroflexota bacterium]